MHSYLVLRCHDESHNFKNIYELLIKNFVSLSDAQNIVLIHGCSMISMAPRACRAAFSQL